MSRILKVILYQTAESLGSPRWELRRIANQVGPGHVKNTQSYIIPDCRKSRQSTLFSPSLIQNSKLLVCFCDSTSRFVLGLVGTPKDRFSHVVAQIRLFKGATNKQ